MNLRKIKGAVEREGYFEVDDGSGRPFKVAKAGLSPELAERVRSLYCGGKVEGFAEGGTVPGLFPSGRVRPTFPEPIPSAPVARSSWADSTPPEQRSFLSALFGSDAETPPAPPAMTTAPVGSVPGLVAPAGIAGAGEGLTSEERQTVGSELSSMFSAAARAQAGQPPAVATPPAAGAAPVAAGENIAAALLAPMALGGAGAPEGAPGSAAPTQTVPGLPSPGQLEAEARSAGDAAARRIAEAGDLAKRSLAERSAAEAQARAAEMAAAEGLVRAQDEAAARAEQEAARARETYQRGENALRLQREKLAQREKDLGDLENMRVESGRVFSRTDPVGLIMGAMMVGAAEAGLRKGSGSEAALKVIGDAIDRDVLAQKSEIEGVRSVRLRAYESAVGDVNNAAQLLKADQQLVAAAAAKAESQRTQGAQGRLMLAKLSSDLSAQARQTADDAIKLITGQAIAEQKAASDAQSQQLALRGAQAAMVREQAELVQKQRQEVRADEALAQARQRLGLEARGQALKETVTAAELKAAQAKEGAIDYDVIGRMGYGLTPDQWARVDKSVAPSYVIDEDDEGLPIYRRARDAKSAEQVAAAQVAAQLASAQLAKIEKYIPGPGKTVESTLGFGEKARVAEAELAAATQALTTQLKEIEKLGALTGADLALIAPRIPTAQAWLSSDVTEQQQAADLRASIEAMVEATKQAALTPIRELGKKPTEKGGR